MQSIDEAIKDILSGKVEAPSEFTRYLVDSYSVAHAQYEAVGTRMAQLKSEMMKLQEDYILLQGGLNKTAEDIRYWYAKALEDGDVGESESDDGSNGTPDVEMGGLPVHGLQDGGGRQDLHGGKPD
jgi:hypothetical protein